MQGVGVGVRPGGTLGWGACESQVHSEGSLGCGGECVDMTHLRVMPGCGLGLNGLIDLIDID